MKRLVAREQFGEEPATPDELYALLKPCPDEALKSWPVDKSVGNVRNKGPQLITPIDASLFGETVLDARRAGRWRSEGNAHSLGLGDVTMLRSKGSLCPSRLESQPTKS
jgi:hypothetical protein